MLNDHHTLNRRLIYSAQQLNTIESINATKQINHQNTTKDENSDNALEREDNHVFILGYN
jgi:hypothetical protein